MIPLLAIPIVSQATQVATIGSTFFTQPIDEILFDLLLWFGWIPIALTFAWGIREMWLNYRRGMFVGRLKFVVLAINVPAMTEQTPKALENMFNTLYSAKSSITWKEHWIYGKLHPTFSFEIVSSEGYIQFIIRTQTRFRDVVEAGIYAHYPEAEVYEVEDYAKDFPNQFPDEEYEMWGAELTLARDSMFPIRTYIDFEDRLTGEIKDPLGYTLEQLAKMRPGEHFWIQLLIQPSNNDWADKSVKHVRAIYGDEDKPKKSMLAGAFQSAAAWPTGLINEAIGLDLSGVIGGSAPDAEDDPWKAFKMTLPQKNEAEEVLRKAGKNGFGSKIRIVYVAQKNAYVKIERTAMVKGIFNQYTNLHLNKFTLFVAQVPKDDYFWMRWSYTKRQRVLMSAYQNRSWGVGANPVWFNTEELATLWHFPTVTMKAPLVKKQESKRGEPPVGLPVTMQESTLLGMSGDNSVPQSQPPGLPVGSGDVTTKAEPPMGLPMAPGSEGGLPNALPQPMSPTQKETRPEVNVTTEPEPTSEPVITEQVKVDPLDHLVEPTIPGTKPDDEEDDLVPPNLPI
jgi:hypothetical protein